MRTRTRASIVALRNRYIIYTDVDFSRLSRLKSLGFRISPARIAAAVPRSRLLCLLVPMRADPRNSPVSYKNTFLIGGRKVCTESPLSQPQDVKQSMRADAFADSTIQANAIPLSFNAITCVWCGLDLLAAQILCRWRFPRTIWRKSIADGTATFSSEMRSSPDDPAVCDEERARLRQAGRCFTEHLTAHNPGRLL